MQNLCGSYVIMVDGTFWMFDKVSIQLHSPVVSLSKILYSHTSRHLAFHCELQIEGIRLFLYEVGLSKCMYGL